MKEVLRVELERSDIEDAISSFLEEKGYKTKNVDFEFKHIGTATKVVGAHVTVTKKEEKANE
jgi:hypothetical protein